MQKNAHAALAIVRPYLEGLWRVDIWLRGRPDPLAVIIGDWDLANHAVAVARNLSTGANSTVGGEFSAHSFLNRFDLLRRGLDNQNRATRLLRLFPNGQVCEADPESVGEANCHSKA